MHDCQFQNEIMELVKESGKQTAELTEIKNILKDLSNTMTNQQVDINDLKGFKKNILYVAGIISFLMTSLFQGAFNFLIHK